METLVQDLRYSFRVLVKSPGFTIVALVALALGIGANTAIFSVVNAVLLRPLPFKDPGKLVTIWTNNTRDGKPRDPIAAANFVDFRDQNTVFEQMAAFLSFTPTFTLSGRDQPRNVIASTVSPSLFPMLGARAVVGRTFLEEEALIGKDDVLLLSYGLWQSYFGGDPNIVGQTVQMSGRGYAVVGVMPKDFYFLYRNAEIWLPMSFNPRYHPSYAITNRSSAAIAAIGRLRSGATIGQARAEMETIAAGLERQYPDTNTGQRATLVPLHEQMTESVRPALLILLGAVAFVLLVACANVATLLLARAASRQKEVAIRTALGAGRWRLARQLLTENLVLSFTGALLGLILAVWGVDLILAMSPDAIPRQDEIGIDLSTLGFTFGLSLLTGILCGLAPTLQVSRADINESLKDGGKNTAGRARQRVRGILVISEVALTLVLLVGAGLLIKSFYTLMQVSPGFNTSNLLTVDISVPQSRQTSATTRIDFYNDLFARIEAIPGVQKAGMVTRLPLTGRGVTTRLAIEGRATPVAQQPEVEMRRASRDYFRTMEIPLLNGRTFTEQDTLQSQGVLVINAAAAARVWPNEDPIGKRVQWVANAPAFTVVGIVGDVRHFGLDADARPEVYISTDQGPPNAPILVIRTSGGTIAAAPAIRATLQALDRDTPVGAIQTMNDVLNTSVAGRRFNMILLAAFAGLALLLAVVGIYGVISYSVNQRTQEIGIRMALGARRGDVLKLVLSQGMGLSFIGIAIGLASSVAVTRLMTGLLFGITATDPLTFLSIAALLAGVSGLACYLPARRATRVDPLVALKYE